MIADDKLRAAAKAAIKHNEGGNYNLSCAGVAESGYSFGFAQGDIRTDDHAWSVLHSILAAAVSAGTLTSQELGVVEDNRDALCAGHNPISAILPKINRILNEPAARQTIDAMDDGIFQDSEGQTIKLFQAAERAWGRSLGLTEAGALAMWSNMTGGLGQTTNRIAHDLIQPRWLRFRDLVAFLRTSKYFREHPHNIVHFLESIALGLRDALRAGEVAGADLAQSEVADLNAELENVGSGIRLVV
jgi:hypothetical protein